MAVSNQWRIQDFPLGGADLRHVHLSAKTYAKMKELDPVGGRGGGAPQIRQFFNVMTQRTDVYEGKRYVFKMLAVTQTSTLSPV